MTLKTALTAQSLETLPNEVVEFAKTRNVELSPMSGMFFGRDKLGSMYIFSTFNDKERRKRKTA